MGVRVRALHGMQKIWELSVQIDPQKVLESRRSVHLSSDVDELCARGAVEAHAQEAELRGFSKSGS